jgi:hypothetical protein
MVVYEKRQLIEHLPNPPRIRRKGREKGDGEGFEKRVGGKENAAPRHASQLFVTCVTKTATPFLSSIAHVSC